MPLWKKTASSSMCSRRESRPGPAAFLISPACFQSWSGFMGGAFFMGSGATDPTPLVQKGVIVVTINYRLGVFGYMSLGNEIVSGNQGLKDQLEAFRWVNRNILAFGGDPSKVTLFGESAGGISVHLHQLSSHGNNLYHGVIAQSGSALSMSEYLKKSTTVSDSIRLVDDLGCQNVDPIAVLQCIQGKTTIDLLTRTQFNFDFINELDREFNGSGGYVFAPVLDPYSLNPFLPEHPLIILQRGGQKDIPLITGVTENEGSFTMALVWNILDAISSRWNYFGPKFIFSSRANNITPLEELKSNVTRHFYVGNQNFSQYLKQELTDMFSDAQFVSPAYRSLEHQSRTQDRPVYFYQLNHKPTKSIVELFGRASGANREDFGVAHGDDLFFLFNDVVGNFTGTIATLEDLETRDRMTTLWTNFAKYQDPTLFQEDGYPIWKPFDVADANPYYLDIRPILQLKQGIYPARMYFWRRFFWEDAENSIQYSTLTPGASINPVNNLPLAQKYFGSQGPLGSSQVGSLPFPFSGGNGFFDQQIPNGILG